MRDSFEKESIKIIEFKWSDVEKYLEIVVDMQYENTYQFHYPDKQPDKEYVRSKILELENHLRTGDTYFIGAVRNDILIGYIWGYLSDFIEEKRFVINSMFVSNSTRGSGVGRIMMDKVKKIAVNRNCDSITTYYATFNEMAGEFYHKNDFHSNRIEMIHKIK